MSIKVIILDFDGVVVQSNNIKHEAFSEIFKAYPRHYDAMMKYHFTHNHVNRRDKFKYFFENMLKQPYCVEEIEKMCQRFSKLTRRKIILCPYVEGSCEFLELFSSKLPLYIASATPLDELKIIMKERGLEKYFKRIYGAPVEKIKMLEDIIHKENILSGEALFIGDSIEDYQVAQESGINFVAKLSDNELEGLRVAKFKRFKDITSFILNGGNNGLPDETFWTQK